MKQFCRCLSVSDAFFCAIRFRHTRKLYSISCILAKRGIRLFDTTASISFALTSTTCHRLQGDQYLTVQSAASAQINDPYCAAVIDELGIAQELQRTLHVSYKMQVLPFRAFECFLLLRTNIPSRQVTCTSNSSCPSVLFISKDMLPDVKTIMYDSCQRKEYSKKRQFVRLYCA